MVTEYFSHYKHLYFLSGIFRGLVLERINLQPLVNEAAALLKVPEFVMCLGHRQPRTRTEGEAQLHHDGVIHVNGIWPLGICLLILAGTGGLFGECLPFPQHKFNSFVYKAKNKPQPCGLSFTWVKISQLHPKLPRTEPLWLAWPWGTQHLPHRQLPACSLLHCCGLRGFLLFFFLTADTSPP